METKHFIIETYGCQMNQRDSELLTGMLQESGYLPATAQDEADLVIINTCCVRDSAERKVYGRIDQLRQLKRDRPGLVLAVCGCMAQDAGSVERLLQRMPHVDLVFGTHNSHRLLELLRQAESRDHPVVEVWENAGEVVEHAIFHRAPGVSASVNIMFGCDNFCSYCIVPYVRGRQRSRRRHAVLEEAREAVEAGYREITLLGQNVNAYGLDLEPPDDFPGLLEALDAVEGMGRLRYLTSHPRDFDAKLIATLAKTTRVCEHVHLPVQAGSDAVLSAMRRGYTRAAYLDLVGSLRRAIPGVAITTDLIVGFPGETEEEFAGTLSLVETVRFDSAFTFAYSPRRGTRAAGMAGQVPEAVKKERLSRLMEAQNRISLELGRQQVGSTVEVLVEGPSARDVTRLTGRTRTNRIVVFPDLGEKPGELVMVRVREAFTWHWVGDTGGPSPR
jgi:tRNA-2-methylthio-N6-dimethylallyladenosine synthase